ncbi:MAG: cupin-like domain-containing protein [Flavobacteriales bacterium]|nr:cupin-like domain-containing protein [Flavobacteriales bacterium]
MPKMLLHGTPIHEVFFGGNGSSFPFVHYDALFLHTQITQIHGDKDFVLFHPDDSPYLYPRPENEKFSQVRNVFEPDLVNFPLFAKAKPYFETIRQGETIFFPCGWWHTTLTHGPSITYGRVVLNSVNYDRYLDDKYRRWVQNGKFKANAAYALGKMVGGVFSTLEALSDPRHPVLGPLTSTYFLAGSSWTTPLSPPPSTGITGHRRTNNVS